MNSSSQSVVECTPLPAAVPAGVELPTVPSITMRPIRGASLTHVEKVTGDFLPFNTMGATCQFKGWMPDWPGAHMDLTLSAYAGRASGPHVEPPDFSNDVMRKFEAVVALVEAAPDLLERLTELLEYSEALKGSEVYRRAAAAIAKAEGRAS